MKFNQLATMSRNKITNQVSLHLRAKALKKAGLTPSDLLNVHIPENIIKIKSGKIYK